MNSIDALVNSLTASKAVQDKIAIREAYSPAISATCGVTALGDDCAALPDGNGGYLLFAAEGLLDEFVADDPWFAGYSAIMVNVSDICAMGGRPLAVTNVIWTPDHGASVPVWEGMRAASSAYGVPIVGGHTTLSGTNSAVHLAASIVGRARTLLTSFDAKPGDAVVVAVDLNGSYRRGKPFWNSSVDTSPARLKTLIGLLPEVAERGWCRVAKDISNGGVIGTAIMLLECSGVGATLELEEIPRPADVDLDRWLSSFPSFGYLLSVPSRCQEDVVNLFSGHDIACGVVGSIESTPQLVLRHGGEERAFWSAPPRSGEDS